MRLTQKGIENIRRGLKRSWQDGSHRTRQQRGEPDADTLRRRALHDRRGTEYATVIFSGKTYRLLWSVNGRCDQLDIYFNGHLLATFRPNLALFWLSQYSHAHQD